MSPTFQQPSSSFESNLGAEGVSRSLPHQRFPSDPGRRRPIAIENMLAGSRDLRLRLHPPARVAGLVLAAATDGAGDPPQRGDLIAATPAPRRGPRVATRHSQCCPVHAVNQWVVPQRQPESPSRLSPHFAPHWRHPGRPRCLTPVARTPYYGRFSRSSWVRVNRLTAFRSVYLAPQELRTSETFSGGRLSDHTES